MDNFPIPRFEPNGYVPTPSGLFIPESLEDLRKSLAAEKEQARHGKYFSDFGSSSLLGGMGIDQADKPMGTPSLQSLRVRFSESLIDQLILNVRQSQIGHVSKRCIVPGKQIGWRIVHERYADRYFKTTPEIHARCEEVAKIVDNPLKAIHTSFKQVCTICVEETLVIDRKVLLKQFDSNGNIISYCLIDGATIKPVIEVLLPFAKDHNFANLDIAAEAYSEQLGIDLTKCAYIQVMDRRIVAGWAPEQIDVDITVPQIAINKILYGKSLFESSLEATYGFLSAWNYNSELLKLNMPEVLLIVQGNYDEKGLESFRRKLLQSNGPAGNWRVPVIPGSKDFDIQSRQLRNSPKDLMFSEMLHLIISLKAAAYRMSMSELNMSQEMGGVSSILNMGNQESAIAAAQEEGFHSLLDSLADFFTRSLVKPIYKDLVFVWDGLNRESDKEIAAINIQRLQTETMDEVRSSGDLHALHIPDDIQDIDVFKVPYNPMLIQLLQMKLEDAQVKLQQAQMQQQMQMAEQQAQMQQMQMNQQSAGAGQSPDQEAQIQAQSQPSPAATKVPSPKSQMTKSQDDYRGRVNSNRKIALQ